MATPVIAKRRPFTIMTGFTDGAGVLLLLLVLVVLAASLDGVSAFQPLKQPIAAKTTTRSRSLLFLRNETLYEYAGGAGVVATRVPPSVKRNHHHVPPTTTSTTTSSTSSSSRTITQNKVSRREVDRHNLHPVFKLEFVPDAFLDMHVSAVAAWALLALPLLLPWLPVLIFWRKQRWEQLVAASQAAHREQFQATVAAYRQSQTQLVDQILLVQQQQARSSDDTTGLPSVIAVTMATGQEGQGVVRHLAQAPQFRHATILALVRNPHSPAAVALAKLSPNVQLVPCDSTDVDSLRAALQTAQAVFLATTLNQASAGHWQMPWDGGQYQIRQGQAVAEACQSLPHLRQIVYGTAPLRKWPEAFAVEPPIHYAAKWKIEQLLLEANLPVTFLRKCPYHENFTKLTKAVARQSNDDAAVAAMGVQAGGAFDASRKVELQAGHYQIKAFTPPDFTYNMMDPRDTGKWAVLAFSHPTLLIGQSLSVASDALSGQEMAQAATECGALGDGVSFSYAQQPRWLFEALAFVEPTFVYISGLQRWNNDGGVYDLDADGVDHVRKLVAGSTWADHLEREGLGQFTETMADLLPDFTK